MQKGVSENTNKKLDVFRPVPHSENRRFGCRKQQDGLENPATLVGLMFGMAIASRMCDDETFMEKMTSYPHCYYMSAHLCL